jgi:hypothetical protein
MLITIPCLKRKTADVAPSSQRAPEAHWLRGEMSSVDVRGFYRLERKSWYFVSHNGAWTSLENTGKTLRYSRKKPRSVM